MDREKGRSASRSEVAQFVRPLGRAPLGAQAVEAPRRAGRCARVPPHPDARIVGPAPLGTPVQILDRLVGNRAALGAPRRAVRCVLTVIRVHGALLLADLRAGPDRVVPPPDGRRHGPNPLFRCVAEPTTVPRSPTSGMSVGPDPLGRLEKALTGWLGRAATRLVRGDQTVRGVGLGRAQRLVGAVRKDEGRRRIDPTAGQKIVVRARAVRTRADRVMLDRRPGATAIARHVRRDAMERARLRPNGERCPSCLPRRVNGEASPGVAPASCSVPKRTGPLSEHQVVPVLAPHGGTPDTPPRHRRNRPTTKPGSSKRTKRRVGGVVRRRSLTRSRQEMGDSSVRLARPPGSPTTRSFLPTSFLSSPAPPDRTGVPCAKGPPSGCEQRWARSNASASKTRCGW